MKTSGPDETKKRRLPRPTKPLADMPEGCCSDHLSFLNQKEIDELLARLSGGLDYEYSFTDMGFAVVKSPRKQIWFTRGFSEPYFFSRSHVNGLKPHDLLPCFLPILQKVEEFTGRSFNALLVNVYDGGNDSLSAHADADPWLGDDFIVPSLTLYDEGATRRRIVFSDKETRFSHVMENGSLLIMGGNCQKLFKHEIPKESRAVGIRYNLTFRFVHENLISKMPRGKLVPVEEIEEMIVTGRKRKANV